MPVAAAVAHARCQGTRPAAERPQRRREEHERADTMTLFVAIHQHSPERCPLPIPPWARPCSATPPGHRRPVRGKPASRGRRQPQAHPLPHRRSRRRAAASPLPGPVRPGRFARGAPRLPLRGGHQPRWLRAGASLIGYRSAAAPQAAHSRQRAQDCPCDGLTLIDSTWWACAHVAAVLAQLGRLLSYS
jgi:hypothetical protein